MRDWNNLNTEIRSSRTVSQFKKKIKGETFKPPGYYNERCRRLNVLHTRLRHLSSSLNADLARIHIVNDPRCTCGSPYEDAIHYLLEYHLYQNERAKMCRELTNMRIEINIETLL